MPSLPRSPFGRRGRATAETTPERTEPRVDIVESPGLRWINVERPRALERCRAHAVPVDLAATSYFVARETLIPSPRPELNPLEERLFMLLAATNLSATAYFRIPPDQVVELGLQLEI